MEKEIIRSIKQNKASFYYGGWGIGKTYLFKEKIFKDLSADSPTLYIDSRMFDLRGDMFEMVSSFIYNNASTDEKVKRFSKKAGFAILNTAIFSANSLFKTNIKYVKKEDASKNINIQIDKIDDNQDFFIIIDELDRVTPGTIMNVLNFINAISFGARKVHIAAIGNRIELISILQNSYGMKNSRDFLHKYFEEEIDLSDIRQSSWKDALSKSNVDAIKDLDVPNGFQASARHIQRCISDIKYVIDEFGGAFSDKVYAAAFVGGAFNANFNSSYNHISSNGDTMILKGEYTYKSKNDLKKIRTRSYGPYGDDDSPIGDLITNYKIKGFEDWVKKWNIPIDEE